MSTSNLENLFGFDSDEYTDDPSIEQARAVENQIFKPNKSSLKETREELKKLLHNPLPIPKKVKISPVKQSRKKSPIKQKQNDVSKKIFEAPVNTQKDIRTAFQSMAATSETNKDVSKEIRDPSPLIFRDLEVEVVSAIDTFCSAFLCIRKESFIIFVHSISFNFLQNTRKSYSGPRQYRKRRISVTSESEADEEEEERGRKKKRNKVKKKKLVDLHDKEVKSIKPQIPNPSTSSTPNCRLLKPLFLYKNMFLFFYRGKTSWTNLRPNWMPNLRKLINSRCLKKHEWDKSKNPVMASIFWCIYSKIWIMLILCSWCSCDVYVFS